MDILEIKELFAERRALFRKVIVRWLEFHECLGALLGMFGPWTSWSINEQNIVFFWYGFNRHIHFIALNGSSLNHSPLVGCIPFSMATCHCFLLPAPFKPTIIPPKPTSKITCSSITTQSQSAKQHLLTLISDQHRGLKTQNDPIKRSSIIQAIDAMADLGKDTVTTDASLSATWRLLWTTEKEQLFIIEKAPLFGTQAGDVLQVIDVEKRTLNNVITFPPDGVFFVRSSIEVSSSQRVNFRYSSVKI